jgi:hypothetical protein
MSFSNNTYNLPASVANKRLTKELTSLDITLKKNWGGPPFDVQAFRHSDGATLALLSLFVSRAFHISFAIKRFHTLSQKCRGIGGVQAENS